MYNHPSQFEPLLPRDSQADHVLAMSHDLRTEAARLTGACQNGVSQELARLLRSMNSYYSNKIEGEHTRPLEIEQALRLDFSADAEKARLQRLAVAHIATEQWLYEQPVSLVEAYSAEFLCRIHRHLFGQLKDADRVVRLHDANGAVTEEMIVLPGEIRTREVRVKNHVAPAAAALPAMLERWSKVYGGVRRGELQIVAAAAAHHRLVWIHPFLDGNGRASRLHSLAVLGALELTGGLWSPLRGLARQAERYSERLGNADMARMGDLDGRGQLSERMLLEWIEFFIGVCLDQVRFMSQMLNLREMQNRLGALLAHEEHVVKRGLRMEALRPLHYLFATQGEISRGDFASMTGLGERTATTLIGKLLDTGLLRSDSPRGQVRFGIPLDALRFLFPSLWPEAEADAAAAR
ncbi:Fic family protein [Roseateles sp. SL47]|uniref:Fic family protein n=1 Tax=Roseateles sp. SL47 TaxID=2995138 RepID=UPI00226D8F66|nr:Fic family protein [Roseateles sp. SL47]WAC74737.1 Fic family protein [Roseateles sp. SL47]